MNLFTILSRKSYSLLSTLTLFVLTTLPASAAGIDNLLEALALFNNQQEIQANLLIKSHTQREGRVSKEGLIELTLSENKNNFSISYNAKTLTLLEKESANQTATENNENVNNPTIIGMRNLKPIQLRNMLNIAPSLKRFIEELTFIDEKTVSYQGKSAILLTFSVNLETIIKDKKDRKHVSKFNGSYEIWTTPTGTPLEAKMSFSGKGSYLFVFKTKRKQSSVEKFQVVNNRLIIKEYSFDHQTNSTFGEYIETNNKTLNILPTYK